MWLWVERLGGDAQNLFARLAARIGVRQVADATQITNQLWAGGAITSAADVDYLVHLGITADVDCRLEFDDQSLISDYYTHLPNAAQALRDSPEIAYLYNGVADNGQPKPVDWFTKTWTFAEPILKSGGVVLCHCAAGVNRGPSMCYFLMRAYGDMSPDDAYALIHAKRPIVEVAYRHDADAAITALGLGK